MLVHYCIPSCIFRNVFCTIELIFPTIEHKQAALDYRQEWLDLEPGEGINGSWGLQRKEYENYEKWLGDIKGLLTGKSNNPNINVPATTYFAFLENKTCKRRLPSKPHNHFIRDFIEVKTKMVLSRDG